jgi:hypothetical protein
MPYASTPRMTIPMICAIFRYVVDRMRRKKKNPVSFNRELLFQNGLGIDDLALVSKAV